MKTFLIIFNLILFSYITVSYASDFQVRSTINKDNDPVVAYNSVDDEYLVVWTEYSNVSIEVLGQRMKADGTGSIGNAFVISTIGAFPSVAYNSQLNEYLVTFSLSGNIIGRKIGNTGNLIGNAVTMLSKTNSIYSKIIYNTLANNYLLVACELFDLGNDQSNIKIFARKITANGQPDGTEQLVRDQGHGNYSDGARFSVAYAPIISTETPAGRYLLAIKEPTDLTMLDHNGLIVSKMYDPQQPGLVVDDHVPFQGSKVGNPYNIDVAFGNFEGVDAFMVVWGDRNNQYNSQPWSGIWAGIVNAGKLEYDVHGVSNIVFPVSAIPDHNISPEYSETWNPVVAYNEKAYKFMIAWRETPTTDPQNDTKVNHIRANAVSSSIPNYTSNVVLSAITGNEDPMNPAIAASTKNTNALVVWDDMRNFSSLDIDLYGNLLNTTPAKTLVLTSPNGNEELIEGTEHQITWASSDVGDFDVTIEYSIDNGVTYNFIAFQTTIDGVNFFNWTVPNTPSTQCKVQITAGGLSDQSDELFTIKEAPEITIISPNGGEIWTNGSQQEIKWNSSNFSGPVNISLYVYSQNVQVVTAGIVNSTPNDGSFIWTVDVSQYTPTSLGQIDCKVAVYDASKNLAVEDGKAIDFSDDFFTITLPPMLLVLSPNGGEVWHVGSQYYITWESMNFTDSVDIVLTIFDQIAVSQTIAQNITNSGYYLWTIYSNIDISAPVQASIQVQESKLMPTILDNSDSFFIITPQPTISVIAPGKGDLWSVGSQHEIKWSSTNVSEIVSIGIENAGWGGGSWIHSIVYNTDNDGSYLWTVPRYSASADTVEYYISVSYRSESNIITGYSNKFSIYANTPSGDSINVDLGEGANITFDTIDSSGTTTLNVKQTGTPPPNSFMIFGSPNYYNIETTAEFTGNIKICINYDETGLDPYEEAALRLYVNDTTLGQWVDITSNLDMANNIICGEVNHLSEFAIMMPTYDPQVIIVTNTNDNGDGSLRRAIEKANEHIGPDTIKFNISFGETNYDGSKGVWLIQPETNFPSITDSNLVIDGTSQRLFIGEDVNKEGPEIEITGINLFESGNFLQSFTNGTEIFELIINNFGSTAIIFSSTNGGVISGCYIGTDYTGMKSESNRNGITLSFNASNNLIGPSKFLKKPNVISGNDQDGIYIVDSSSYNTIIGNYIGVNKIATDTIQNKLRGIDIYKTSDNNTIIGNYVGGNYQGIFVYESNNNIIKNNYIGTNENGEYDLGNSDGIVISYNSSKNEISENLVGNNQGIGVLISGSNSTKNKISWNSISNNLGFGIDNSEGGNLELAAPIISSISNNQISGTSGANQIIEIFADSSDEGQIYIDSTVSDASGNFSISLSALPDLPNITATARDASGNTSEFSSPFIITDIDEMNKQIPTEYDLFQNYPNPFNPSTIISYQLPNSEHILLKIYDVLGREIITLVNQKQKAGKYEVNFDAKNLPSGVYFYQLKTSNKSITKKMLLLE